MHDLIMKIEAWKKADKKTKAELHKPRGSYATYRHHWPFAIYNGMINPIIPFEIKGVLWYQGESNVERAYQYRQLFPALINDWRGDGISQICLFYLCSWPTSTNTLPNHVIVHGQNYAKPPWKPG